MSKQIIVIGAGIVGASLAYHLAAKGAHVTVLESGEIACGATGRSFAWINTSHGGPDPVAPLRAAAIAEHRRLESELPGLNIRWTGALSYGAGPFYAPSIYSAQILDLEPNLKHSPQRACFAADEGALDAVQATHALIAGAQAHGATLLTHTPVLGFQTLNGAVTGVSTATGNLIADIVVLAAGTAIAQLADQLNVTLPIDASPALLIRYTTQPHRINTIISSPQMEIRQDTDGTLLAAEDYIDDALYNRPHAIALRTAKAIEHELHGVVSIMPQMASVGLRPMPADRIPIIGYLPEFNSAYVCVMHPGVTLAAVVGRLVAEEIIDGASAAALEPCRPARFQSPAPPTPPPAPPIDRAGPIPPARQTPLPRSPARKNCSARRRQTSMPVPVLSPRTTPSTRQD